MAASRPRVRTDLVVVELDGEAVIYDDASGELHHLNPSATLVFGLFDGTATLPELATDLSEAFGIEPGDVEEQLRDLVGQFLELGLMDEPRKASRA